MNYFGTEHLIVYAFLGITALVGIGGLGMSAVSGNFKEYATANKQFGTGALVITVLATWISGSTLLGISDDIYRSGLAGILGSLLNKVIPVTIIIYFVAPKIVHFKNCMTAGDLMKVFYGNDVRIITGALAFFYCISICARQFMWLKFLFGYVGLNSTWGLFLGIGVLAFYTIRGGMKAVIFTDILHFIVAFAVVPLLAHLMLYKAGGIYTVLKSLNREQLSLFSPEALRMNLGTKTNIAGVIAMVFPAFALSFPFIQRLLMAKHQNQSVNMYRGVLAVFIPFSLLIGIIGLAGISLYPQTSQYVLISVMDQLSPAGKGLVLVSLLGIIISTVDSFLHTASVSFVHDTLNPLAEKWGIKINELRAVQYTTFFVAFVGFILSSAYPKIPALFHLTLRVVALPFTVPLLAGIIGLKTDRKVFYVSTAITLLAYMLPLMFVQNEFASDIANAGSAIVSIFSYLGAHYYYHQSFEMIHRSAYGQTTSVWHPSWKGVGMALVDMTPTPQKTVRYFQRKITENGSNTTTLAIFIAISYMVPFFMNSISNPESYNWLIGLRMIGSFFCAGLLIQSQWPNNLLRYFPAYYHLALLYCFPFMNTFLFFLEGGSIEWVVNTMLCIMLLIVLLDYATAIGLSLAGILLAMGLYRLGIGPLEVSMDRNSVYMLVYGIGFSTTIGVLFSRFRERTLKQMNRRLLYDEATMGAQFPKVLAETEGRTHAFQQMGIEGILHTARKLHSIQHKAAAIQEEQHTLITSLTQRQEILTQEQQSLLDTFSDQKVSQTEFLAQQKDLAQQQKELQKEFNALTQQQPPKAELAASGQPQAPHEELHALAQHHMAPHAELDVLAQEQQDLQADLLPLVMQLQDLDTRGKDHLTLNVHKDLLIEDFLLGLQDKLLPRGIDVPLLIERKTKQVRFSSDAEQLTALLVKGIAALQWLLHDQDDYLLLGIEDTQLSYALPDVAEGYVKQVPALKFTLTTTGKLPEADEGYTPELENFAPVVHETFETVDDRADARLVKAHYGYRKVQEDTLTYVVPVDVYAVRPKDMDKPALALGALPKRADDRFKHDTADAQMEEKTFLAEVAEKSQADLGIVKLALNLIKWYHGPKSRHSGEPFYLHPLAVARIALDYSQDESVIIGALLHDTVEDTPMLMAHIEALFGKETAEVVDLVTHLQSIKGSMYKIQLSEEENLRMLGHTENKRALCVKIADRMHNMRTISGHKDVAKRKRIAQETLNFFVPIAQKLGLKEAVEEFEKVCAEVMKQEK